MPAHNEAALLDATVGEILRGLRARGLAFEVLVVENGSTDATRTLATDLAAREPEVVAHTRPVADYGEAIRDGILTAQGDAVVLFDVDYYDLEFLDRALARLDDGRDRARDRGRVEAGTGNERHPSLAAAGGDRRVRGDPAGGVRTCRSPTRTG